MKYGILKNVIDLLEEFETENSKYNIHAHDIEGFKKWIVQTSSPAEDPYWEGKESGRSAESVISTLIVHMNRYAKSYARSAIFSSDFSSQEDFIYLINLKTFGAMSKMDLIRKNVHEKPVGIQIINRLIRQGWVDQNRSETDRRSNVIGITPQGLQALEKQMDKIRQATKIVAGNLAHHEKMELVRLLKKLDVYHKTIYDKNIDPEYLLDEAGKGESQ